MANTPNAPELVFDLIFGRWRSQTLYAGAALGVFDQLSDQPTTAAAVAETIKVDPSMLYRLMRALGSIGLLIENDDKAFRLTDAGALLREDHQHSLRATALLEEGPEHYAIWKHLVDMVRDGRQNGFEREFGQWGLIMLTQIQDTASSSIKRCRACRPLPPTGRWQRWRKRHALTFAMYATLVAVMAILGAPF